MGQDLAKGYIARKSFCAQEYAGLGRSACSGARRLAIVYGRRIHVGARHAGEDYAGLIAESPVTGSCPRQNCRQRLYAASWHGLTLQDSIEQSVHPVGPEVCLACELQR